MLKCNIQKNYYETAYKIKMQLLKKIQSSCSWINYKTIIKNLLKT